MMSRHETFDPKISWRNNRIKLEKDGNDAA
jgi:hypothetical protein